MSEILRLSARFSSQRVNVSQTPLKYSGSTFIGLFHQCQRY